MNEEIGLSPNSAPASPNITPGWHRCLECPDLGVNCNGPSLRTLGDIASARAYHKALRKVRKIPLKKIAEAAHTISEATVNEYFSNAEKDYKWTTVFVICDAMVAICGDRVGLPPLSNPCPASTSEVRSQLAAADLKLAAAELKAAQADASVVDLQKEVIEVKARSAERIDQMQKDYTSHVRWIQKQLMLWQVLAIALAVMAIVILLLHAH